MIELIGSRISDLMNINLQGLPTSISSSLGGLGPNPLHPALSMLKPQLPDAKREDELRKSLSESNGETVDCRVGGGRAGRLTLC